MRFEKWQALGNDYLILEAERAALGADAATRVERLCDPHFGVGADGVLLLSRSEDPEFVAELRIFNPDGSEAELSGNGAREAILYLRRHGWTDADTFSIRTAPGRSRRRSPRSGPARWRWAGHRPTPRTSPRAGGRPGHAGRRRPRVGLPARLDRQPAVRDRRRRGARGPRPGGDRARRSKRDEQFPNRTNVSFLEIDGSRVQGADLRARGGGDAFLGDRRLRRRGDRLPARGRRARSRSSSTAASSRSRSPRTSTCA